ncbi:MAG: TIGR00282 family metallophosphoesterase [Oscillospiraceae bacterium]|nr:TIGR00282 family metallophosphoesterase [Oscillospiraceae bacterium]
MKILAIGDIVGTCGLDALRLALSKYKRDNGIDFCIVNGENSADGNGITPTSADHIFTSGADVITTGNHAYRRKEMYRCFEDNEFILRPCNFNGNNPGHGFVVVDMGKTQVAVVNLMGTMYMDPLENPFLKMDNLLKKELSGVKNIIVDFHAEATSEKRALGFYLDGRVTAIFGTHTHVQTSDEQILPNGTGYITDVGMTGALQSVLGVDPQIVIDKFKYNMPARFDFIRGDAIMSGCIFEIDENTGLTTGVSRVCLNV